MYQKKKKEKKKHFKDKNIAVVEKNISVDHCGLTLPYHNAMKKVGKRINQTFLLSKLSRDPPWMKSKVMDTKAIM